MKRRSCGVRVLFWLSLSREALLDERTFEQRKSES